ncbi:unnamed protein product [Ambrosiozyma monospora]|uniref:Unnamed protein product n=1 Tax=Ambrosiozyma monospora TaxID=43982 RepID=A0ACB5UC33_AMBMO|nr:unnamed protein product [Ambrosiozyma monospora]
MAFKSVANVWNSTGRALCRVSVLLLRLALSNVSDFKTYAVATTDFANSITTFLACSKDILVPDQLALISNFELLGEDLQTLHDDVQLVRFIGNWCDALGLRDVLREQIHFWFHGNDRFYGVS